MKLPTVDLVAAVFPMYCSPDSLIAKPDAHIT